MKNILVLCTGNSCRSQMAEGYLRHFGKKGLAVYSAGIETHGVNPKAIKVMLEDNIDISDHTSDHLDEFRNISFDYVITVCDKAKESCPYFPGGVKKYHHGFSDPAKTVGTEEEILGSFRSVRDSIKAYCLLFLEQESLRDDMHSKQKGC